MIALIALLFLATGDIPDILRRAMEARSPDRIATAAIQWSDWDGRDPRPRTTYHQWRCAGEDIVSSYFGDAKGNVSCDQDGEPVGDAPMQPERILFQDGRTWSHFDDSVSASSFLGQSSASTTFDFRQLLMNPVHPHRTLEQFLAEHPNYTMDFRVEESSGYTIVAANGAIDGVPTAFERKWWIDPEKDYSVVRTQTFYKGKEIGDTRFWLEQQDGVWYPRRVEERTGNDLETLRVVEIIHAEFNRPEHPQEFGPADIGIEPGTQVTYQEPDGSVRARFWDGSDVIPAREWYDRLERGEARLGPNVAREVRRIEERSSDRPAHSGAGSSPATASAAHPASAPSPNDLSVWEAFTRDFIAKYRLNVEQSQRAWQILRECQQAANRYLSRHEAEIAVIESETSSEPRGAGAAPAARKKMEKLLEPVQSIFENELKPRLEKLPTREQRRTAQATSAPAASNRADRQR